jgi:hypothetical protein
MLELAKLGSTAEAAPVRCDPERRERLPSTAHQPRSPLSRRAMCGRRDCVQVIGEALQLSSTRHAAAAQDARGSRDGAPSDQLRAGALGRHAPRVSSAMP